jgi:hypothetical protein
VVSDQVVDVIVVGHRFVPAIGAMRVTGFVSAAQVIGGAGLGVLWVHRKGVFVDVIVVRVVQVTVVEVVDVIAVLDRRVAAVGAVDVGVVGMRCVLVHGVQCPCR